MRISKNIKAKAKQFAFVVDGECEYWYIQMLKRNEKTIHISLKPELPQKKKLTEQYDRVIELSKDYDKVFWILDLDVILKETRETSKGMKSALQELKKYHKKITLNEKYKDVNIIINNPCLEYWYLLHFEATSKYFESYGKLLPILKKHKRLSDYEKTEKYYTKQNHDIYLKLKPYLFNTIENANKLKVFDFEAPQSGLSQMQLMLSEI
ncbi:MAG: hypothetical protein EZS26_001467 [Candidatus Ordinivivax streblomastigis]|uniref:RloB-like protein n=1 Tax=Candidatus Ordinivivax streblomastigis TaxID=2540710 RepID=A0A5M8P1T4_9BACT|nr:MAG: hypothetical protein EZS26_001467 [Candidatus Ordinivivax streblomastigis]